MLPYLWQDISTEMANTEKFTAAAYIVTAVISQCRRIIHLTAMPSIGPLKIIGLCSHIYAGYFANSPDQSNGEVDHFKYLGSVLTRDGY